MSSRCVLGLRVRSLLRAWSLALASRALCADDESARSIWAVGRLQTDADRARVVESLAHAEEAGSAPAELASVLRRLGPRWFLVRDVHASTKLTLLRPRWALSYLRGPMRQSELRRALERGVSAVPAATRVPAVVPAERSNGMGKALFAPMPS